MKKKAVKKQPIKVEGFITLTEYCKKYKIHRHTLEYHITNGNLKTVKVEKKNFVEDKKHEPVTTSQPSSTSSEKKEINWKLEQLKYDVQLKKQKLKEEREAIAVFLVDQIIEKYFEAFEPLKLEITALKLRGEELEKLRKTINDCNKKFADLLERIDLDKYEKDSKKLEEGTESLNS